MRQQRSSGVVRLHCSRGLREFMRQEPGGTPCQASHQQALSLAPPIGLFTRTHTQMSRATYGFVVEA